MVAFTASIAFLSVLTNLLYAACGSVFATAGWTAPACLASGVATLITLGLTLATDVTAGTVVTTTGDPETVTVIATVTANGRRAMITPAAQHASSGVWYRHHASGEMEDFTGRVHELYGLNETATVYHAVTGSYHTVEMRPNGQGVRIRTNMKQKAFGGERRRRQAESPSSSWGILSSLQGRDSASSDSLDEATLELSQITTGTRYPSDSAAYQSAARTIADSAIYLGTYCVTLSLSGNPEVNVGLTYNGKGHTVADASPCMG